MGSRTNPTQYLEIRMTSATGLTTYSQKLSEFKPSGGFRLFPISQALDLEINADNSNVESSPTESQRYRIAIDTYVTEDQWRTLDLIKQAYDRCLRERNANRLVCGFNYKPIDEHGDRTRPVFPGTAETVTGEDRSYFPIFKMKIIVWEPGEDFNGPNFTRPLRFELHELDRLPLTFTY